MWEKQVILKQIKRWNAPSAAVENVGIMQPIEQKADLIQTQIAVLKKKAEHCKEKRKYIQFKDQR